MTTESIISTGEDNNDVDAHDISTTDEGGSPLNLNILSQLKKEDPKADTALTTASTTASSSLVSEGEVAPQSAALSDHAENSKVEAAETTSSICLSPNEQVKQSNDDVIHYIDLHQSFSFVHKPPSPTTYRFDLKDASTISPGELDEEIRTTLLAAGKFETMAEVPSTTGSSLVTRRTAAASAATLSAVRVIKAIAISATNRKQSSAQPRAALLEAGRENRRVERDRRRALAARNRAVIGGGSPTSSASSGISTEKMRCLRCLTLETPQWRYIHKGRYCNACYMRVKRWVENNRPGRKLPSRVKNPLSADEDARLQQDADDLVSQAFEALERQGI